MAIIRSQQLISHITQLAERIFNVPSAMVSITDKNQQWFQSCLDANIGADSTGVFCAHTILTNDMLVIQDALLDERFRDDPLVTEGFSDSTNIRFYAGIALTLDTGKKIGTLCIISPEPRTFNENDRLILADLAVILQDELKALSLSISCELTGLTNRRGFFTFGQKALEQHNRINRPVTIAYFDIDNFKFINDTFGHAEGDHAIISFASFLTTIARSSDIVSRQGGDEFAVLMPNCSIDDSNIMVSRLRKLTEQHNTGSLENNYRGYELNFSVGLQSYDVGKHDSLEALVASADATMFENKRAKKMLALEKACSASEAVSILQSIGLRV